MPRKMILAALVSCTLVFDTQARETKISVDTLMSRIERFNPAVKAAQSQYLSDKQGIDVAKDSRLPSINAELQLNYIGDGTIIDRDFAHSMRDKLPHFGNTLNVSIYQPVYHGGIITATQQMAELRSEMSRLGLDQQLDASTIEALSCYFRLMQMLNMRKVYQENIDLAEKVIENIRSRHEEGLSLKNDITRYELRLSSLRYELSTVENTISVLNNDLVSLLGESPECTIIPEDEPESTEAHMYDESYWQNLTLNESTELKSTDVSKKMEETSLRMVKGARMPMVGLVAVDNLSGPVTFEIPAINKNYNAWFLGLSVKYDISSLYTNPKKEKQKEMQIMHISDQRYALESALQRRVHDSYVAYIQSGQMLETELANVKLANENYEIVRTRFDNDMAIITDMIDASTAKLDSETRLVNAEISRRLAYYQLKYISGSLRDNAINYKR